jgi:hypothetical protein
MRKLLLILFSISVLSCCAPNKIEMIVYTSDIELASEGEIIEIPLIAKFSMMGETEDLEEISQLAKKYLHPDSTLEKIKGDWGDVIVVSTKIPMGTSVTLKEYAQQNRRLMNLLVSDVDGSIDNKSLIVTINATNEFEEFNTLITNVNFMLGFDLPAALTNVRVISDSKNDNIVTGNSIWVNEKAYVQLNKKLSRREEVELGFKGSEDSIYSQVPIKFFIKY